jgi:enamine deaminase RidA (YjgF/YER057c/UK114 family)
MTIVQILSPEVAEPAPGMWSNCLKVGDTVYVSGLTARDKSQQPAGGSEYDQARLIFARMAALVEAAGGSLADVVKLNIYLTNIGNREGVWRARRESFSGVFPACTLVEVSALAPGIDVEIEAVALLHQGGRPAAA